MWAALALTAVVNLAPAQAGDLELKNVRLTYGVLGQTRKDDKILPGDIAVVSFDIKGLKAKDDGSVAYATGFELTRKGKDKPELKQDLEKKTAVNNLGGDGVPSVSFAAFGLDTVPGTYVIKVTVEDSATKKTATLSKEVEVVKPKFGFVRVRFMAPTDERFPLPAPPVAVPGQMLHLRYALANFAFDKKDKLPHVSVELVIEDDAGKKTVEKPAKAIVRPMAKEDVPFIDFLPIPLQLNRPGKFKVILKAKCIVSGESAEQALDLTVLDR